jgi:flagellar basal-body rod protein FlgG
VQLADGNTAYTRDGEFQINAAGLLVTKQGFPVMGDSGPIQIDLNNPSPVSISAGGDVSQGADIKGKLRAVEFDDPNLLTPINSGYFLAGNPGLTPRDAETAVFRQGFLESANTSAVSEMAHLIAAMRMFEANQKVIQTHDERMGRAISELGNPN